MIDFRISKYQAVTFTPDLTITNSLKLLNTASDILEGRLDGEVTVLPIPQDAPGDIPRILSRSADKRWMLQISLKRTDLFYRPKLDDTDILEIRAYVAVASKFFAEFQEEMDLRVQRLALITERFSEQENAPAYIVDKFCKEEYKGKDRPFNHLRDFQVHSLKRYKWFDFTINSWVRFKSAYYPKDEKNKIPIILLENDLNTLPYVEDPDKAFSREDTKIFFEKIPSHLDEILNLYFFERSIQKE